MGLSKQTIQKSVSIVDTGESKVAEVLWVDRVVETVDDVEQVLSETNRRCAYCADDKERFLADVEGAEDYLVVLGW